MAVWSYLAPGDPRVEPFPNRDVRCQGVTAAELPPDVIDGWQRRSLRRDVFQQVAEALPADHVIRIGNGEQRADVIEVGLRFGGRGVARPAERSASVVRTRRKLLSNNPGAMPSLTELGTGPAKLLAGLRFSARAAPGY